MGLKELTTHKHRAAEQTAFMQRLISGTLPREMWADFLYQKISFYHAMESVSEKLGLLSEIPDLKRSHLIEDDFQSSKLDKTYTLNSTAIEYTQYLNSLDNKLEDFIAHIYTWHLGDLYGGQLIKHKAPGSCKSLEYSNPQQTAAKIRTYLTDSMSTEVCKSFDFSIKLMEQYDL